MNNSSHQLLVESHLHHVSAIEHVSPRWNLRSQFIPCSPQQSLSQENACIWLATIVPPLLTPDGLTCEAITMNLLRSEKTGVVAFLQGAVAISLL